MYLLVANLLLKLSFLFVVAFSLWSLKDLEILESRCLYSIFCAFLHTTRNHFVNLLIRKFTFELLHSLSLIPILLGIIRKLVYSGCHVRHDHSRWKNINLVIVDHLGLIEFRCNKLSILVRCRRPCHCLVVVLIPSDWIKVGQLKLVTIGEYESFRVYESMHRLLRVESIQHRDDALIHLQKLSLWPTIAFLCSIFAFLLKVMTFIFVALVNVAIILKEWLVLDKEVRVVWS